MSVPMVMLSETSGWMDSSASDWIVLSTISVGTMYLLAYRLRMPPPVGL